MSRVFVKADRLFDNLHCFPERIILSHQVVGLCTATFPFLISTAGDFLPRS